MGSLITLLKNVNNPFSILKMVFGAPEDQKSTLIKLRSGEHFYVRSLLDIWVIKETILDRQYESASTKLMDGWRVVDIGAAMGDYSVWAARQVPNGSVVAVEPFPDSVELLHRNLSENHVENVRVIEKAVSGSSGNAELNLVGKSLVQHSTSLSGNNRATTQVSSITLAELLHESQIETCDYLKMDCEGGEYDILFNSSTETLFKIKRICMEVHDGVTQFSRADMLTFLEGNGYRTKVTPNPVHEYLSFLYAYRPEVSS